MVCFPCMNNIRYHTKEVVIPVFSDFIISYLPCEKTLIAYGENFEIPLLPYHLTIYLSSALCVGSRWLG